MQKYSNNIINQYGAPIAGASVKILSTSGSLAPIYSDNNSSPLTNPTTSDEYGQFYFYAKNGRYSIVIEKQGVISQTISDILLEDLHDSNGNILVTTPALIGYGPGSGGSVIQPASDGFGGIGKGSRVTLDKPCGQITMNNAALAAGASAYFDVSNSFMSQIDNVMVTVVFPGSARYSCRVAGTSNGAFAVYITNEFSTSLSDAVVLNFAIIKGSAS